MLIAAIDTDDHKVARALADAVAPFCAALKIGPEFLAAPNLLGYASVSLARHIMLDVKLHDTPRTVERSIAAYCRHLTPWAITVHAAGGRFMLAAARDAVDRSMNKPMLFGITVLTSVERDADTHMIAHATQYCEGLVCPPRLVRSLRAQSRLTTKLIVPGITSDDVARRAIDDGANYLVIGRLISESPNPAAAAERLSKI